MRSLVLLLLIAAAARGGEREITRDRRPPKGTHLLREPLRVAADGITVDLAGVTLAGAKEGTPPDRFEGVGLLIEKRRDVTIKGGRLRGFRCAILVRDCERVVLEGIDVSGNFRQRLKSTPEREDPTDWLWPHRNDNQEWRKNYGAGICLENCRDCEVHRCTGRKQQNGIILDRCESCRVRDNDMSFNSGWGLALWRSTWNRVYRNRFDWCVRGYSHGIYDRGQDSAGILVFEHCNRNMFLWNSATHGGDGFFLFAGHDTLNETGRGGCNGNLVADNDFSHAVANGIEATFSRDNTFLKNRCDDCNYGIWAGYSYKSEFEANQLRNNSIAGIAIEHGRDNVIKYNTIEGNPKGIWLWWDDDKDLLASEFGRTHDCRSEGYHIVGNRYGSNEVDLFLRDTSKVAFGVKPPARIVKKGRCEKIGKGGVVPAPSWGRYPELPRMGRNVFLPEGHPRGREYILVDEWGPLDPREHAVFPKRVVSWESCAFHVLGKGGYEVEGLPEDLRLEKGERTLKVSGGADGLRAFTCTVVTGGKRLPVSGVLLNATWEIGVWKWSKDPREHAGTFGGDPAEKTWLRRLDFRWKGGGPLGGDRFATRARTRMRLPAGRYEIRTVSDDGVRVLVDGRVVQEDWTWHAPRENKTTIELPAGNHEIVVEHFEIDGYAVLSFDLRPVP